MGTFRKLDSLIPEADEADEFGQHAVALMRRTMEVGYLQAVKEEFENPTWNDPYWCAMIAARHAGQVPVLHASPVVTFRCHKCLDTGFVDGQPVRRFGMTYQTSRPCDPCLYRLWEAAQIVRDADSPGDSALEARLKRRRGH